MDEELIGRLTELLWEELECHPWEGAQALAEALIWLLYARWLDRDTTFLADTDMRWCFWRELSLRQRFRHVQLRVYPFLQTHAPMSGHLLGLILPTVPFGIPDALALQGLLGLIETHGAECLLEAALPLLGIEEPTTAQLEEALTRLEPQAEEIVWEPFCRSGRLLAACSRRLQQRHWRTIWAEPGRLRRFRQQQFFGRVSHRTEALLSSLNLLLADQLCPGLDGYGLPWPAPSLIWSPAQADYQELLSMLAPGGRLAIWHPAPARRGRVAMGSGSLEIMASPTLWSINEPPAVYRLRAEVPSKSASKPRKAHPGLVS